MYTAVFTPPTLPHLQPLLPISPPQSIATVTVTVYTTPPVDIQDPISTTIITQFASSTASASMLETILPDTNAVVTSVVYSTTTAAPSGAGNVEMAMSTVYITTVVSGADGVVASMFMSASASTSTSTTNTSKQTDPTTATPSISTSISVSSQTQPQTQASNNSPPPHPSPTTTTINPDAVVTSVVFSTTVIGANQAGSGQVPRSTVYLTTVVGGR